jgi:3'(2'), 5'-bisphosphate nucleotidase
MLDKKQIKILIDIALKSGEIALEYFDHHDLDIQTKDDDTPVTKADKIISSFIAEELSKNFPDICIICEEGQNRHIKGERFWLIDPIDGTKSFIAKENEFTVNIALIENKIPIFGLIYAPKIPDSPLYYTDENQNLVRYLVAKNQTQIIQKNEKNNSKITRIISSKRSTNAEIMEYLADNFKEIDLAKIEITKLASSFKFCRMVEGEFDLFLSLKTTMEWDIGAGHALILANNKKLLTLDKSQELSYHKNGFINNGFVVI